MSVQSVSPFSNFKTNNNTSKSTVTKSQAVQNVAQEAGKISKKTAIIGGLAALAFAGTVAAVAIKRHKAPDEIQSALNNFKATNETANTLIESVKKQADEATEYAQKLFDEVTELFKKGDEIAPDGKVLRKITSDDAEKIMEEFSQDGKLFRKSTFVNDILDNVQEGIKALPDGTEKVEKEISFFHNGSLFKYQEGVSIYTNGTNIIDKEMNFFKNGEPCCYQEGYEDFANGPWNFARKVIFENKKPCCYIENIGEIADEVKISKEIYFEDGKPRWYQEDYKEFDDGLYSIAKEIYFEDGKPALYEGGIKELPDGTIEVAKEFELTNKGWKKVGE